MGSAQAEPRARGLPAHLYTLSSSSFASHPSKFAPHASGLPLHVPHFALPSSNLARDPAESSRNPSELPHHSPTSSMKSSRMAPVFVAAPSERPLQIQLFSPQYYAGCAMGGVLACGTTHMAVTPFDVVKCNMQIDPIKYQGTLGTARTIIREQGLTSLARGWAPTLIGYSAQGAGKYGLYEFFKKYYTDLAGPDAGKKYKTALYLAGSASAEVIADVALCPFEAVKVRVQTQPGFARGLADGLPKLIRMEGIGGVYKGIGALWARQVPYTMMKFATFENTVEAFYTHIIPTPKEKCSVFTQLGVSFASGYIAGIACAVVSHPADNLVSYLNNAKGATVGQALKQMGVWNLFTRGLPVRIVMIGTLTAAQWSIYDSFKVFLGFPTTGGAKEEESLPLVDASHTPIAT